jgi:hypothetical protein
MQDQGADLTFLSLRAACATGDPPTGLAASDRLISGAARSATIGGTEVVVTKCFRVVAYGS